MKHSLAYLCFLAAMLLPAAPNQKSSSAADAVTKLRLEWSKDLRTKQLDKIAMLYAPDATFFPGDGQRITGRSAIRELCKTAMAMQTADLTFHSMTFEQSGDLAYDSGDFHEDIVKLPEGSKAEGNGNYFMVFKRQAEGNWLILQQGWIERKPAHE